MFNLEAMMKASKVLQTSSVRRLATDDDVYLRYGVTDEDEEQERSAIAKVRVTATFYDFISIQLASSRGHKS